MTFAFLNRDAISGSRGFLENHNQFQTIMVKITSVF